MKNTGSENQECVGRIRRIVHDGEHVMVEVGPANTREEREGLAVGSVGILFMGWVGTYALGRTLRDTQLVPLKKAVLGAFLMVWLSLLLVVAASVLWKRVGIESFTATQQELIVDARLLLCQRKRVFLKSKMTKFRAEKVVIRRKSRSWTVCKIAFEYGEKQMANIRELTLQEAETLMQELSDEKPRLPHTQAKSVVGPCRDSDESAKIS